MDQIYTELLPSMKMQNLYANNLYFDKITKYVVIGDINSKIDIYDKLICRIWYRFINFKESYHSCK